MSVDVAIDVRAELGEGVPAEHVTACAFGGADGRSLFIVGGPPANVFHAGPERSTAPSDAEPTSAR